MTAEFQWWRFALGIGDPYSVAHDAVTKAQGRGMTTGRATDLHAQVTEAQAAGNVDAAHDVFNVADAWTPEGEAPREGSAASRPEGAIAGTKAGLGAAADEVKAAAQVAWVDAKNSLAASIPTVPVHYKLAAGAAVLLMGAIGIGYVVRSFK